MMFCLFHRWGISRSLDTHRPLGRRTRKHLDRCEACERFRRQCLALHRQLPEQAETIAFGVSPALHARIMRRCQEVDRPAAVPAVNPASAGGRSLRRGAARFPSRPVVALAAAAAVLLLVVIGSYFHPAAAPQRPPGISRPVPPAPAPPAQQAWPWESLTPGPASVATIDQALQHPVQEEMRLLREDGKAAADVLLACVPLDIRLRRD